MTIISCNQVAGHDMHQSIHEMFYGTWWWNPLRTLSTLLIICAASNKAVVSIQLIKVRLHGRRQAARLVRNMLQRDLLGGNRVYMVGSCVARLLHMIPVSAVSEVNVLQEKCSWQPVPRDNFKFKLKMSPGLAAVAHLLRAACRRVNTPVVFLCFYFAARLSRRSCAACRVPFKCSLSIWMRSIMPGIARTLDLCLQDTISL